MTASKCQIREWAEFTSWGDYVEPCDQQPEFSVSEIAASDKQTFAICGQCMEDFEIEPTSADLLYTDRLGRLQQASRDDVRVVMEALAAAGDQSDRIETVREWLYYFPDDPEAAADWIDAGYWDPETAYSLARRGYDPDTATETLEALHPDTDDVAYAVCNNDIPLPTRKAEQNTRAVERLVRSAAAQKFGRGKAKPVYEHGQWWVFVDDGDTERSYSVVDASPGIGDTGLDFEQVSETP